MTAATHEDPAPGKNVVLYDGDCAFCLKGVAAFRALDWLGRLRFHNFRDPATWPPCGDELSVEKMNAEMHVVPADRYHAIAGFKAVRWMLWRVPPGWLVAPLWYVPGVPWVGTRVYRWIARNRYQLAPCAGGACAVPRRAKA